MSSPAESLSLRSLTIILLSMAGVIVAMTGWFLYLKSPGGLLPADSGHQLMLAILAGMALMESPMFFGVRAMKVNELRQRAAEFGVVGVERSPAAAARRVGAIDEAKRNRAATAMVTDGSGSSRRSPGPVDLHNEYMMLTLIAASLAEGFALFGSVVYLLSGSMLALIAPAAGVLVIMALLPNADRIDRFARDVTG